MSFSTLTQLRITAATLAVQCGKAGTSPVKHAEEIFDFLSADEISQTASAKPATSGAKAKPAAAPDTDTDAAEPSSDKPATTPKAKPATPPFPSEDKGAGFADDGSEITIEQIRTAAVKFSAHPKGGEKKFVAKLKDLGSDNLSGLDPAQYGALIEYLDGATAEGTPAEEVSPFE
jgi:hypothetical protein